MTRRVFVLVAAVAVAGAGCGGGYFAQVPVGDDIVGLTRAFLFAGTPSVVASRASGRSTTAPP